MKYAKKNKIKMATRFRGEKKDKDANYEEFFKDEVNAVRSGAKKPDTLLNHFNP